MPVEGPGSDYNWTGFYIGAHAGYGWKTNDFGEVVSVTPLVTLGDIGSRGWVFGGHTGFNKQYGRWVAGLEFDISAANISGDSNPFIQNFGGGITISDVVSDNVKYLGTARARVGVALGWDFLFYGTAGLAWERLNRVDTQILVAPGISQTVITTQPRDHFGWVVGVGGELRLGNSNWLARLEYLHYDFGEVEQSTTVIVTPGNGFADRPGRQTIDVVRAALSYKFSYAP
jgi:outer membrane immunogenic protein